MNRHFRSRCLVGAVSNCAYAVRLETAPTGVIARIFPSPVGEVSSTIANADWMPRTLQVGCNEIPPVPIYRGSIKTETNPRRSGILPDL